MHYSELFSDKSLKTKEKVAMLSEMIEEQPDIISDLIDRASGARDPEKATILEALENVSRNKDDVIGIDVFHFASSHLDSKASRVKWEAAKIVGTIISRYPEEANEVVPALIKNARDDSTVVRWSSAYALSEILGLRLKINEKLIPQIIEIMDQERKNSINKMYSKALKQVEL